MKKWILIILTVLAVAVQGFALSYRGSKGQRGHRDDFMAVLPFVWDDRMEKWGKCITDNLDRFANNKVKEYGGMSTYDYWNRKFGLHCSPGNHRYFFHWGYQRMPWSDDLLRLLPDRVRNNPVRLQEFKDAVRDEQRRRNRLANEQTEKALCFGSKGAEARYANAFVAIIYDVHILGDYETKNIKGLAPITAIVSELNTNIRALDAKRSADLTRKLTRIANGAGTDREKAALVLQCLRDDLPTFILRADDGRVNMRRHFVEHGFEIKKELQNKL